MTPKAAQKFSYYCSASFKILAVNLSNSDLLTRAKLNVSDILKCADILFLNKQVTRDPQPPPSPQSLLVIISYYI